MWKEIKISSFNVTDVATKENIDKASLNGNDINHTKIYTVNDNGAKDVPEISRPSKASFGKQVRNKGSTEDCDY